jgi:hypothetical protein
MKNKAFSTVLRLIAAIYVAIFLFGKVWAEEKKLSCTYPVVDTGQTLFFDNLGTIPRHLPGQPFFGQDAHYSHNAPSYTDNGDGTVTDNVTGLVWQKAFSVMTLEEAARTVKDFSLAGKRDWRIPGIKELYSLALFSGVDASSPGMEGVPRGARPFIADIFDFRYGANGDRPIDTQLLSSTLYQGTTMGGNRTVFGFNAADGRIKGYPVLDPRLYSGKKFTVRFVRGNPEYGKNAFRDNHDGTVTDQATGLMWEKSDSGKGMHWQDALDWVAQRNGAAHRGYKDWRLPNAKELQSIIDYTRSPQKTSSPAIAPVFEVSAIDDEKGGRNYPFYWTSTTLQGVMGGREAVYVCFGDCYGFFRPPDSSGTPQLTDVHGAGAQRSDPKVGDARDFPQGRGPQGDVVRILNYVRMVRDL